MKKILFLLLLLSFVLQASQHTYEIKIYSTIFKALFPNKTTVYVWSDCDKKSDILHKIYNVRAVNSIEDADILLLSKSKNITSKKMKFVTNYKLLKHYKKSVIGGFYWKKGRPNIIFLRRNLQKYHIKLPQSMQDYVEDNL